MPFDPSEIERRVLAKFGERSAECIEGPHRMGDYEVTRVWTEDAEGNYQAHYAATSGTTIKIFRNFSPFANWLARRFDLDGANARDLAPLPMVIASLVVLIAMGLVIFIVVRNPEHDFPIAYVLTAVVGGGAGFLFARSGQPPRPQ